MRKVYDDASALPPIPTMFREEEGRTRQELSDGTRIQDIVDRMMDGGLPEYRQGRFEDVSDIKDLHTSLEQVRRAQLAFNQLPPQVRRAFDNDPAKFTDAFQTEEGVAKLRELKVLAPTEEAQADAREAAAEERAARRVVEREKRKRIADAEAGVGPPSGPKA